MNKIIKNIGFAVLMMGSFGYVLPVMAQTASPSSVIPVAPATATEIKVESKAAEKMQTVRNFVMRMANRFDVSIRNLESLSSRIARRIGKLDQAGKDTAQAKAKLNEANTKIQEAKDAVIKLQQGVESAISSANPKKNFAAAKDSLVKGVMDKVKSAHKALVEAVVILAKISQSSAATSTAATSTP